MMQAEDQINQLCTSSAIVAKYSAAELDKIRQLLLQNVGVQKLATNLFNKVYAFNSKLKKDGVKQAAALRRVFLEEGRTDEAECLHSIIGYAKTIHWSSYQRCLNNLSNANSSKDPQKIEAVLIDVRLAEDKFDELVARIKNYAIFNPQHADYIFDLKKIKGKLGIVYEIVDTRCLGENFYNVTECLQDGINDLLNAENAVAIRKLENLVQSEQERINELDSKYTQAIINNKWVDVADIVNR